MQSEHLGAVPLFPLPNVVLLPAGVIPLHVFESRYCALVEEVLRSNQLIGLPQLAPGWEPQYHAEPTIYPVFGLGRIVEHESLDDGRYNILVEGIGRVRLLKESLHPQGFRQAEVSLIEDETGDPIQLEKAHKQSKITLGQLISLSPKMRQLGALLELNLDAADFADTLAHALMSQPADRQNYIETSRLSDRMRLTQQTLETVLTEIMSG